MNIGPFADLSRSTLPGLIFRLDLARSIGNGVFIALATLPCTAWAHHPHREFAPVRPRYDLIHPLGNRLPAGYRRTYNRPSPMLGRISHCIAPSSQEAMSWHRAEHRGDYDCDRGRVVPHYEYLKPWQAIRVGSRPDPDATLPEDEQNLLDDAPELEPEPLDDLVDPMMQEVPLEDVVAPVDIDSAQDDAKTTRKPADELSLDRLLKDPIGTTTDQN